MNRFLMPINANHILELFEDNPAAEAIVIKSLEGSIYFSQSTEPRVDPTRWSVSPAAFEMQAKLGNLPRTLRWKVVRRS